MAELAKNILKTTNIGQPVMFGEAVGRIVSYSDKGSWGTINGSDLYSVLIVSTPHGSEIESGVLFISEITSEGLEKLEAYESELNQKSKPLYNSKLDTIISK